MSNETELFVEPQMVVIEDEKETGQYVFNHLDVREFVTSVAFIDELEVLNEFISVPNPIRIFWVDLNLGEGRENDGITMIKAIRLKNATALIIVFSAHGDKKRQSINAGANHFFIKQNYEETLKKAELIIIDYVQASSKNIRINEFDAQIAHIDRKNGFVKLECKIDGDLLDNFQPLDRIAASISGPLEIDINLKVKIVEINNQVKISFKQVEQLTDPSCMTQNDVDDEDDDLMNSDFWKNTL